MRAAIEQYRACVRTLHRELGVAPLAETTELYEQVSTGKIVQPAPQPPAAATPVHAPVVAPARGPGRRAREPVSAWQSAAPDGRLVVIEGEAGIGKTRLADELAARAGAAGAVTVVVRAAEAETELPYAAVLDAMRQAQRSAGRVRSESPTVPALIVSGGRTPRAGGGRPAAGPATGAADDSPGAGSRFLSALADVLTAFTAGLAPGPLVVDDAQWVDCRVARGAELPGATPRGPRALHRCCRGEPRSCRPGHALRELLADARRSRRGLLVAPKRLGRAAVTELARAAGAVSEIDRLYDQTAGLPLFVVEYLAALGETAGGDVPEGVAELLRHRAAAASEGARQVLAAAAVLGTSFDLEAIRETSGRSDEETVAALEELEVRGLLSEDGESYAFAHDSMRSVIYADTSLARRRLLHRRAAEALAARSPRDRVERAAVIAEQYRLAGRDADAAEYHRLAGERARELLAPSEALAHFRAALALGHPDEAVLHEAVGELLMLMGEYGSALTSLEAAAALATDRAQLGRIEHELGAVRHRRVSGSSPRHATRPPRPRSKATTGSSRASRPTAASTSTGGVVARPPPHWRTGRSSSRSGPGTPRRSRRRTTSSESWPRAAARSTRPARSSARAWSSPARSATPVRAWRR